jgi:copper chaperone CopZ
MRPLAILILASHLAVVPGCGSPIDRAAPASPVTASRSASLAIEGMTCASCSVTVQVAVRRLDGIATVAVDVDQGRAVVTFDPTRVDAGRIAAAVTAAGYSATVASEEEINDGLL